MNNNFANFINLGQSKALFHNLPTRASSTGQAIMNCLIKYKDYLLKQIPITSSFIGAFVSTSDLVSTDLIGKGEVAFSDELLIEAVLESDQAELFIQGVSDAIHNGVDEVILDGITITDAASNAYNIIDQRSNELYIDGRQVIFSMTMFPSKLSECILSVDSDNKFYFNNLIRTSDFIKSGASIITPSNCFEKVASMCLMKYGQCKGTLIDNLRILNRNQDESTVVDYLSNIAIASGISFSNNIVDTINALYEIYAAQYDIPSARGFYTSIWNVINDNIESSELNDAMYRVIEAVTSQNPVDSISNFISENLTSKFKSVVTFGKTVSSAFNRGGIYGVAVAVINYLKEIMSINQSTFEFTDNSKYATRFYLAGLLKGIFTVIATVGAAVVAIFSRIAGVAVAVLGSVGVAIASAFEYDYSQSLASISNSDKVFLPIFPYAIYKGILDPSEYDQNSDILQMLKSGIPAVYIEIPGAFIIYGSSFDDDGNLREVKFEMHISCLDPGDSYNSILNHLYDYDYFYLADSGDANDKMLKLSNQDKENNLSIIFGLWKQYVTDNWLSNVSDGYLSVQDDKNLFEIFAKNHTIAGIVLALCGGWDDCLCKYRKVNYTTTTYMAECSTKDDIGMLFGLCLYGPEMSFEYEDSGQTITVIFNYHLALPEAYTWKDYYDHILEYIEPLGYTIGSHYFIDDGYYYDSAYEYPLTNVWMIIVPKYDRGSMIAIAIATVAIAVVTVAAIAVATFTVRKAIAKKQAANQIQVAKAYDDYMHDPSDVKYQAYRKAVIRNNLWANLIGGSKFDTVSYWNGATNEKGATSGSVFNSSSLFGCSDTKLNNSELTTDSAVNFNETAINKVHKSVTGRNL